MNHIFELLTSSWVQKVQARTARKSDYPVGMPWSTFNLDENEILVRQSFVDGSVKKIVPQYIYPIILHFVNRSTLTIHPGERQM